MQWDQPFENALAVEQAQQNRTDNQMRNRINAMRMNDLMTDKKVQEAAAIAAFQPAPVPAPQNMLAVTPQPNQQVPQVSMNPAPSAVPGLAPQASMGAPFNPLVVDPQAAYQADKADPATPNPTPPSPSDPYAVTVPNRAPRSWLQEQVQAGKLDPQAAIRYDTETQAAVQQETIKLQGQAKEYESLLQSQIEYYTEKGDTPAIKKLAEQAKKEMPGNPFVQRQADLTLKFIEKGGRFEKGNDVSYPVTITEQNTEVFTKKFHDAGGDKGVVLIPGDVVNFTDNKGRSIKASISTSTSKESTNLETRKVDLRTKQASGVPLTAKEAAELKVIDEVQKEQDTRKASQTRVTVDIRKDGKEAADKKKEESRKSPDEDMLPMAMEYFVTHKLPGNMRDPVTQKQFRRVFNNTLKKYGISPETWAKMGPDAAASQKALNRIRTVNAQVARDEETARTLLKNVVTQGKAVSKGMSGFKKVDDWVNHLNSHYRGNPKAVNIENTIYEALVDYGKVMGGNIGAGGLTDSARKEAQNLLTAGMAGGKDIQEIVDNMIANMEVRTSSNKVAENSLKENITGALKPGGNATAAPAAPRKIGRFHVEVE